MAIQRVRRFRPDHGVLGIGPHTLFRLRTSEILVEFLPLRFGKLTRLTHASRITRIKPTCLVICWTLH
jgi:hypothetical protein